MTTHVNALYLYKKLKNTMLTTVYLYKFKYHDYHCTKAHLPAAQAFNKSSPLLSGFGSSSRVQSSCNHCSFLLFYISVEKLVVSRSINFIKLVVPLFYYYKFYYYLVFASVQVCIFFNVVYVVSKVQS